VLSPHTAWGLVSSRTGRPISDGACLSCSSPVQARRFEADHGRQVPHRCLERLVGPRNRTEATKTPSLFAAVFLRKTHLPADALECLPKDSLAHVVPGRAWRVLAVLKTMTSDYAASDTGAQEFNASFTARHVAFLTAASIPKTIPNRAIVSGILAGARVVRLFRPVKGEMY
jgi:hypothetical protein